MLKKGLDRKHVSELDVFLNTFDETHVLSESQQAEIEKHARIARLRDEAVVPEEDTLFNRR